MLRSKSRSGYFDFGQKRHPSVLSRSISATKLCRGESQVDRKALVPLERNPSSKNAPSSENRIGKASAMQQQQMVDIKEELKRTKNQLEAVERERDRAVVDLRETKQEARQAFMRLSEALLPAKADELKADLRDANNSISIFKTELELKGKHIESLKFELENARPFEAKLAETEEFLDRVKQELSCAKASLLEGNKRIESLEEEIRGKNESESRLLESLPSHTKQLEETKIKLEESKLKISDLHDQIEKLQISAKQRNDQEDDVKRSREIGNTDSLKGLIQSLETELRLTRDNLTRANEAEKFLTNKIATVENELKMAIEAEDKSKKAMDDLALALKEVATEANQAKENLASSEIDLKRFREEADYYRNLSKETKKECELHQNTTNRLRIEAEESLLAWNGKEMGFVSCIKKSEEERALLQHENSKLTETLKSAENTTRKAREEIYKLRDILKQALNEANVAKEAASIAKSENSELKDLISDKDEALHFLTDENERLRINEVAAHENIKELKMLLSPERSELKAEEKNQNENQSQLELLKTSDSSEHEEEKKPRKGFSFDLNEFKIFNKYGGSEEETAHENPEKEEALKGSIFDTLASPKSEPHTPRLSRQHHRRNSSAFTDGGGSLNSEDFENLSSSHYDDADESSSHRRRRLLKRFGDLIYRRSFHKRDSSSE